MTHKRMDNFNPNHHRPSRFHFHLALLACLTCAFCSSSLAAAPDLSRPDIILIMGDDIGYSDFGCFGGEIKTPHIDSLAAGGLRFTDFHSENMCWVSRAAMLTGSYHKASLLNKALHPAAVSLPEVLKTAGYKNHLAGKWHLSGKQFPSPLDRGFDHFYGILGGASSFFAPYQLTRDRTLIEEEFLTKDYYFTNAISDEVTGWIKKASKDQPLFINVAYTAAHWPLHAFEADIKPYHGKYAKGWDYFREQRFKRMKEMGIIPADTRLSPRHANVPAWEDAPNKAWEQRRMEVYAAQLTVMDRGIGQIIDALKIAGRFDNTIILMTLDNGGCHVEYSKDRKGDYLPQKTRDGKPMKPGNLPSIMPGPENTYQSYGYNWANMSNTPYRYFKQFGHEGGIRTPMIVHWPAAIKDKGKIIKATTHLVDLKPTLMAITKTEEPKTSHGKPVMPMDGLSLHNIWLGKEDQHSERFNRPIFFDHAKGKALRHGEWKIVMGGDSGKNTDGSGGKANKAKGKKKSKGTWQLYHLSSDLTEMNNLAASNPEKLKTMVATWEKFSQKMKEKNGI